MIQTSALAIMVLLAVLAAAAPIAVMIVLRRRGGRWSEFLVGAGTFFLFALVLEQLFHSMVQASPLGPAIGGNIWLYGLYGGLAAGVFEEVGRFLAFKLVLRSRKDRIAAISCGIGHGGCEAVLLLSVTYVNNLILLLTLSGGGALPPELTAAAERLSAVPVTMYLWAGLERVVTVSFHMALSVLVFTAATRPGKRRLFPVAILLHAAADFTALVSPAYLPVAAVELLLALWTLAAVYLAMRLYKKLPKSAENP